MPVHIEGAWEIMPPGANLPRRRGGGRVRIRFGAPIHIEQGSNGQAATDRIGRAIRELQPSPRQPR
jgi:hypothetical protein